MTTLTLALSWAEAMKLTGNEDPNEALLAARRASALSWLAAIPERGFSIDEPHAALAARHRAEVMQRHTSSPEAPPEATPRVWHWLDTATQPPNASGLTRPPSPATKRARTSGKAKR